MLTLIQRSLAVAATFALAGCATNGLYQWGGYEDGLYAAYKDATKAEALRLKLEAHIQAMEQAGQKVAPGLYAEVGTLYLQAGRRQQAIGWYQRERQAWPESQQFIAATIQNLERLEAQAAADKSRPMTAQEAAQ